MEEYIKLFEKTLLEMEKYERLADEEEKKMLENPEDEEIERMFDEYYRKQFDLWQKTVILLRDMIKCDSNTAKRLIAEKREEIKNIIKMLQ